MTSTADTPALLDLAGRSATATGDLRALAYGAETKAILARDDEIARRFLRAPCSSRREGRPGLPASSPDADALEARLAPEGLLPTPRPS